MNIKQIAIDCGMVIRSVLYGDGVFNTITCTDKDLEVFAKAILASEQEPVGNLEIFSDGQCISNNVEIMNSLPIGKYKLYLHPSPALDSSVTEASADLGLE